MAGKSGNSSRVIPNSSRVTILGFGQNLGIEEYASKNETHAVLIRLCFFLIGQILTFIIALKTENVYCLILYRPNVVYLVLTVSNHVLTIKLKDKLHVC